MLDRQLNIFFFFSTIFVFLLFSEGGDHLRFFSAIILSLVFVLFGYLLNWLTLDGAVSAVLFGIISFGLGGLIGATVVLVFFITSSLFSKDQEKEGNDGVTTIQFRRNGMQVWSNGFWYAICIILWFASDSMLFLIAAISSMAFSTADTWSSEIGGNRVKGTTWQLWSFKQVAPGVEGGISIVGTFASVLGACIIGIVFLVFNLEMPITYPIIIIASGFVGSFVDSIIGTYIQGNDLNKRISSVFNNSIKTFDNNLTNFVSSGFSSLVAMIVFILIN